MNHKVKKIFVMSAGGTAGHVFPAVALATYLKNLDPSLILKIIVDSRGRKYVSDIFDEIIELPVAGFNFQFFLKSPFLFLKSLLAIRDAIKLISFGGYISFWPFWAAFLLCKKRAIFQLDSHVTRLNRLLIPFAHWVYYAFAQTNIDKAKRSRLLGIPLRKQFGFTFLERSPIFTIVIIGGSLGSAYWENILATALEKLPKTLIAKLRLFIQTKNNPTFLSKFKFHSLILRPFFEDTSALFKKADLIVARAGAITIAEISAIGRPAFLVPWPGAIENHQMKNAQNYARFHAARLGTNGTDFAEYITLLASKPNEKYKACENALKALPKFDDASANFILLD